MKDMRRSTAAVLAGIMSLFLACGGGEKAAVDNSKIKAYMVGGGIASITAAAFLVRDGKVPGKNITIFEESTYTGGSLDGKGSPDKYYVIRGGRMMNFETFECTWNLLKTMPSLNDPKKTVWDEIVEFNKKVKTDARARLIDKDRNKIDVTGMGFTWRDRMDLLKLMGASEESIGNRRITDYFQPSFFQTNFWYMWATMFAFQPWHSAIEFKRYLYRFTHEFPRINTLAGVTRTPYNQYDALVRPIVKWLEGQGVRFEMGCRVTDLDFKDDKNATTVTRIHCVKNGAPKEIAVGKGDLVFVTNGSMTAESDLGSMTSAPKLIRKKTGGSWALWEKIAKGRPEFGHPEVFDGHIDESLWESFTVTLRDPLFFNKMKAFTTNDPGTGALVTFRDSNWLMSVVLAYQPHFINQPANIQVFWGYGLFPNKVGNFVKKKMSECTGEEILTELCYHLKFDKDLPQVKKSATVIPCMMPYITAQFEARKPGDRPLVVPKGSTNLAFLGQFSEIPDDTVFTVEYSVRSAMTAVYTLLHLDREVTPIYKGSHHLGVLWNAMVTSLK